MVSLDKAVIARMHKGADAFEILVDSDKALDMKEGRPASIENALAIEEIFSDAKKGERAPSKDLEKHFGSTDKLKIAEEIIRHGEVQLTTEQKRKMAEAKYKEIADIISKQGIDPHTNLPHPPQRIANAMEHARVNVDPFRPASAQIKEIVEKIQEILPIRFERLEIAVRVPIESAGKAAFAIRKISPIKKEEWQSTSWIALMEIPAGMQGEIYSKLNDVTGGRCEVRVVRKLD